MISNESKNWHPAIKLLHWLMAILVFSQFALGWLAKSWPLSPTKLDLFVWHKSIGMLILALALIRIAIRLSCGSPKSPAGFARWEVWSAQGNQFLLYALMLAMPVSGWIINSAANMPFRVFWWFELPDLVNADKGLAETAELWHMRLFVVLTVLVLIHAGAALNHHFRKRNAILVNMLPKLKR